MKILKKHRGQTLGLDRDEAIDLIAKLSDCLRRQTTRRDNRIAHLDTCDDEWSRKHYLDRKEDHQSVAVFSNHRSEEPERHLAIQLADLPIDASEIKELP